MNQQTKTVRNGPSMVVIIRNSLEGVITCLKFDGSGKTNGVPSVCLLVSERKRDRDRETEREKETERRVSGPLCILGIVS